MSITDDGITILSESDSWQLLASVPVGRLVTSADGQPEVFPVDDFLLLSPGCSCADHGATTNS